MSDIVERLRWRAENTNTPTATTPMLCAEAADTITALRAEVEQHQRSFDLRWDASMRAIARWQEANPGNDLNWPDHADLVVWLLERDAALRAENDKLRAALESAEGNFYNMANAIDDADYRGTIPGLDGIVVGHFEEYHKGHVGWLVKYAEETRAALTTQETQG